MADNILDKLLNEKIEEYEKYASELKNADYVKKILIHFLKCREMEESKEYQELSWQCKEKKRLEYDCDAYYYNKIRKYSEFEALYSDTMVSFWTPYKLALYQNTGWSYSKSKTSLEQLIKQINCGNKGCLEVNKKFESFAKVYYTKGNFMLLPDRKMNNDRNKICEDRIDETLYQCFEGGLLSKYFNGDDSLRKWVEEQNLYSLFITKDIKRENIIPFSTPNVFTSFYMSIDQICEYIGKATEVIKARNQ
ncbi:hypothetical protein [Anaerosporobacter sp.]|uniref:hypothetical protein n=1 Tax=Anaerosporobacter sp. TaxID=1872529 RepID=UPI00286F7E6F|nr:hypothetical protein [Anaerosporobacter sp.]